MKKFLACLLILLVQPAWGAGAFVQIARNTANTAYVNIVPSAGNLLVLTSGTSAGGGSPTVTAIQAMSAAGGTGTVLASFTVPAGLATTVSGSGNFWITGAYLANIPSGIASILLTINGGAPGQLDIQVSEYSGLATTSPLIVSARQYQAAPGTTANALSSGTASVSSIPAFLIGSAFDENGNAGDIAAGTNFTKRGTNTTSWSSEDRRETGATGSYASTFTAPTNGGADKYDTTMLAFSEASAGPGKQAGQFFLSANLGCFDHSARSGMSGR